MQEYECTIKELNERNVSVPKEFTYIEEYDMDKNSDDLKDMNMMYRRLLLALDRFSSGKIPGEDYSFSELKGFCESLVRGQRNNLVHIKAGSWNLGPDDPCIPSDARVHFIFLPTYIASAILSRFFLLYEKEAKSIENYEEALNLGLKFCTYRRLMGHGITALYEAEYALEILEHGDVEKYLMANPSACPELLEIIKEVKTNIEEEKKNGTYNQRH